MEVCLIKQFKQKTDDLLPKKAVVESINFTKTAPNISKRYKMYPRIEVVYSLGGDLFRTNLSVKHNR